jgi:twitching motility protein PilT
LITPAGDESMYLRDILLAMIEERASDLHLIEGNPPSFIINGELAFHGNRPLTRSHLKLFLDEVMEDEGRKEAFRVQKETDFAYELEGKARFRIHAYFQRNSIAYAIRMIPLSVPAMAELGLPEELKDLTRKRSGLILVVGPAKSGKSTTVAAMVNMINEETSTHIVTIENPIEYVYRQKKCIISQREVKEDALSVPDALRHILRQSPGVVVVDGVEDKESVRMILETAETGNLVICTLRAWNAAQSINRLLDHFPEGERKRVRTQISHTLIGLVTQRLLRRKSGKGYVCACEVLPVNDTMRGLIRDDQWNRIPEITEGLRKEGVVTMNDRFSALLKQGLVDIQEITDHGPGRSDFAESILLH